MDLDLKKFHEAIKGKLPDFLGIEIKDLQKGKVLATMPVETRHHQPMGVLHGGASVALAETAASVGGWYLVAGEGKVVVGQEINANHLRQKSSGILSAQADILHEGKSSQVWEIKIRDEYQKLICVSRCTLAVITPR